MRKPIVLAAVAALAALALVAVGAYVYYFSGLRSAPAQLGLTATPTATATATPTTPSTGLAGKWTVASGSIAGYRVKELFAGQASKHEAVARTSTVSGSLAASGDSTGYQVSALTFTVGLADLHSVDTVAGRNVTQRDGVVFRQLNVQQFPDATFAASAGSVPSAVTNGQVDVSVTGQLTIHGVTRDVTLKARAQLVGDRAEIAGSTSIDMSDYGVSPPQVGFVTVDSTVLIEFDIFMTKTA
jgi:polyisoprenoid-binding protein YceI